MTVRLKSDIPRLLALILALGGGAWAVVLSVFLLGILSVSMWRGSFYLLCGYAVFFWWIYRVWRVPSLGLAVFWWTASIIVNTWFLRAPASDFRSITIGSGDWFLVGWWGFATIASVVALISEIFLQRRVGNET